MTNTFVWTKRTRDHIAKHDVSPAEARYVIVNKRGPFPRQIGDGKLLVHGPTRSGRFLQVIFVLKLAGQLDYEELDVSSIAALADDEGPFIVVVHARDLTSREKSLARKHYPTR